MLLVTHPFPQITPVFECKISVIKDLTYYPDKNVIDPSCPPR